MSEDTPTCQIHEGNKWLKCNNLAMAGDPQGLCILHCQLADKDKDGEFSRQIGAKLKKKEYDFSGVFFPDKISFHGYVFDNPADFQLAIFNQDADFSYTTFTQMAEFDGATFSSQAFFHGATFFKRADFHGDTFSQNAYFDGAHFISDADFYRTTFFQKALFIFTIFAGPARFVCLNPQREDKPLPPPVFTGIFHGLQLSKEASLLFQDVSMARTSFAGTDIRRLTFRNVDWHPYHSLVPAFLMEKLPFRWQKWFPGRQAVSDEILLQKRTIKLLSLSLAYGRKAARTLLKAENELPRQEDYARVEELYRGLKMNYGEEGDYKRVGDFHYGEMEMHRRANPWRWVPLYWYNLYKFLSGYGERPLRALGLLAVFLVGLAGLVLGLGLEVGNPPHSYITGFGDSFIYLLQKATLQRPTWAEPVEFVGKLVVGLSVLLIPGQAALFLLALRNRLGRRR